MLKGETLMYRLVSCGHQYLYIIYIYYAMWVRKTMAFPKWFLLKPLLQSSQHHDIPQHPYRVTPSQYKSWFTITNGYI